MLIKLVSLFLDGLFISRNGTRKVQPYELR